LVPQQARRGSRHISRVDILGLPLMRHELSDSVQPVAPRFVWMVLKNLGEYRRGKPNNYLGYMKPYQNNGVNHQPQLVIARFLNHKQ